MSTQEIHLYGAKPTEVSVTPSLTTGTKIANISVNGSNTELYAPEGGTSSMNKYVITATELFNGENQTIHDLTIESVSKGFILYNMVLLRLSKVSHGSLTYYYPQNEWGSISSDAVFSASDIDYDLPTTTEVRYTDYSMKYLNNNVYLCINEYKVTNVGLSATSHNVINISNDNLTCFL